MFFRILKIVVKVYTIGKPIIDPIVKYTYTKIKETIKKWRKK